MDPKSSKTLVLHSPAAGEAFIFPWPLVRQTSNDIIATMKWVLEDLIEFKSALEYNVLQEYDGNDYESMKLLCQRFNKAIDIVVQMEKGTSLPMRRINKTPSDGLLGHILRQTYNISVQNPQILNKYQVFSPEVYGEVSHELMSSILNRINITQEDVFIDLGSGVGHLVLQLAAGSKCKLSFGIEKEKIRHEYAESMSENFRKWMQWYGKKWKPYQLIKGDFLSPEFREIIKNSSIIFVNNLSFGPIIDHKLTEIFCELKNGTRIISSKSFCPINMRITERNVNDLGAITHVFELSNLSGTVSWTSNPVPFFLHIIDRLKLDFYNQTKQTRNLTVSPIKLREQNPARKKYEEQDIDDVPLSELKRTKKRTQQQRISPVTKSSKKENIKPSKSPTNQHKLSREEIKKILNMRKALTLKNKVIAKIHEEKIKRTRLLKRIKDLRQENEFLDEFSVQSKNVSKQLLTLELKKLILVNQELYTKAKLLQKEVFSLERDYLELSQERFCAFIDKAETELNHLDPETC